jgi:HTH-type transcriptional regulator, sugar sensing transcriptional regulator
MEDVVKNLESLGFTNYESRVFYALFKGHIMTPTEIAKEAKIPRSSAYDILKSFAAKGICNEIQTSTVVKYELIDPKVVEDKIEKEIHSTYQNKLSKLKDSFVKLEPVFLAREMESQKIDVELIKGFNRHRHVKFLNLMQSCQEEVLLMNKLEGFVFAEADEASIDLHKRGGVIRTIYEANLNFKLRVDGKAWQSVTPQGLIDLCYTFMKQGEQIKLTKQVPQNIAIFDRKIVFISLVDPLVPKHNRSDIIVKNQNFAQFMVDSFESNWEKALTVEEFKKNLNIN